MQKDSETKKYVNTPKSELKGQIEWKRGHEKQMDASFLCMVKIFMACAVFTILDIQGKYLLIHV